MYDATEEGARRAINAAVGADLVVKASGVGVFDALLEAELLQLKTTDNMVVFWDVDAPATLDRVHQNAADPFAELIPRYDAVFTYGGGNPVIRAYTGLGARMCVPIYNALSLGRIIRYQRMLDTPEISVSWGTGYRIGRNGWRNFFSSRPRRFRK